MKVLLTVPGHDKITFNSYEDLNIIWQIAEEYPDCEIKLVYNEKEEYNKEVNERVLSESEDAYTFEYKVPKLIVFQKRFQDRLSSEVAEVLNNVYPDRFNILDIYYSNNDGSNINVVFKIEILDKDNFDITAQNIDEGLNMTIQNLVDYYMEM